MLKLDKPVSTRDAKKRELQLHYYFNIEKALELMRQGQYGACEICEEQIPLARLQALPYATLCIQCQREAEKSGNAQRSSADWGRLLDSVGDSDISVNDIEIDVS